jgi:hypothetical protein
MAIDIPNLLEKRTFTPPRSNDDGVAHPNGRRINILDVMKGRRTKKSDNHTKVADSTSNPTTTKNNKKRWIKLSEVDLLDLLDKTWTPLGSRGHPERRLVNILDVMDAPMPVAQQQKKKKNDQTGRITKTHASEDQLTLLNARTRTPVCILDVIDPPASPTGTPRSSKKSTMNDKATTTIPDLVDLLDPKTRTPLVSNGHPERRRINILDVMRDPRAASPVAKANVIGEEGSSSVSAVPDLLELLDSKTRTPHGSAGHPERRKINILDLLVEKK